MEITVRNLEDMPRAAAEFMQAAEGHSVIAFDAGMGVGKTTLISQICRNMGVTDDTSSPTFAIVNEYVAHPSERVIYHFDCYRLEDPAEALDMGVEEYLESGNLCLIEWPEIIDAFLPDDTLWVSITEREDGARVISF